MFFNYDRISRVLFWGCVCAVLAEPFHLFGVFNYWSIFFTSWLLTAGTYLALATLMLSVNGKAVIISGCDTGFGHAIALHLHKLGFRVFAGCLRAEGEGAQRLKKVDPERLHVLQLDVTRQDDINKAVKTVKETLKTNEVLWGLINNAGIHTYGAVEWVSMETYRKISEVNLFGVIALTKACLPLIRRAKGRVLNVTSARGRMASPLGTTYEATKFAIEGFSDGLRQEMRSWGVNVVVIEPGNYVAGTSIYTKEHVKEFSESMWQTMDQEVKSDYGKDNFDTAMNFQYEATKSGASDVTPVLEAMTDGLLQKFPQGRYQPMGFYIYALTFVSQHFPEWVYDYVSLEILMKQGW